MDEIRDKNGLTEEEFLTQYNDSHYKKPSVTVDDVLFTITYDDAVNKRSLPDKELQVLLVKRGGHPYYGQWALPGGFLQMDEDLDTAAMRELKEETDIDCTYMEQLYSWGEVKRDPRTRVVSVSYMALIDSSKNKVQAGDDADEAQWFSVKDTLFKKEKEWTNEGFILRQWIRLDLIHEEITLSSIILIEKIVEGTTIRYKRKVIERKGVAFDHSRIIQYSAERLRNKLEYTDIVFGLMPERFTLSELQKTYEVILGKKLNKANFRQKVEKMVTGTNEVQKGKAHKPAELYQFNANWAENDNF